MDNTEGDFLWHDFHFAEGCCLNKRCDFPQRQFAIKSTFVKVLSHFMNLNSWQNCEYAGGIRNHIYTALTNRQSGEFITGRQVQHVLVPWWHSINGTLRHHRELAFTLEASYSRFKAVSRQSKHPLLSCCLTWVVLRSHYVAFCLAIKVPCSWSAAVLCSWWNTSARHSHTLSFHPGFSRLQGMSRGQLFSLAPQHDGTPLKIHLQLVSCCK